MFGHENQLASFSIASASSRTRIAAQKRRPGCEWAGCKEKATHRAPKGRDSEKDYWRFCLEHVREYNQSYNFFAGMSDAAVMAYQKDALTGHRPTWKMGTGKGKVRPDFDPASPAIRSACSARACAPSKRRARRPRAGTQRRAQGARHARARGRRHQGAGQGALQAAGKAPSSGRQWRRPLDRGPPGRGHPVV